MAFAVVVLLAATTGGAIAHELQHAAHHNAATHGSGICAWMCATAGAHVAASLHSAPMFGLISLLLSLGFAVAMVLAAMIFNLVSDIIGGVWISVIEEETARPVVESNPADDVG